MINEELMSVLACPKCKKSVRLSEDGKYIECPACSLSYPIEKDIPVMLIDSAVKTDEKNQKTPK